MTRRNVSMNRVAIATLVVPLIALGVALPSRMYADSWDKLTKVTFSGPVEIPGQVLPAGTYWFKLLNSPTRRDIVQIYTEDKKKQIALIMAIPDYKLHPTDKTVITFEERAANAPPAVKAWFYPGDNYGQQFVYPKPRAVELAKATHEPVLAMPAEQEAATKQPEESNVASAESLRKSEVKAEEPTGEEVEITEVVQAPPTLPSTASELPLIALGGLIFVSLGALTARVTARVKPRA